MLHYLYNSIIRLYYIVVIVVSPFHSKAKKSLEGRKNWRRRLKEWRTSHPGKLIWVHCSSLGEFEQGRPLIEEFKSRHSEIKICLTFFSPSGYEVRKNYSEADGVFYLPFDLPKAASDFIEILQPSKVFFIKYEFWANYFLKLKQKKIPLFMVSVIFREDHHFFKYPNAFSEKILSSVNLFFLQNNRSQELLQRVSNTPSIVTGDTRFDRVIKVAETSTNNPLIEEFIADRKCVVSGSSYSSEDEMIRRVQMQRADVCFIIAPHDIHEDRILEIEKLFDGKTVRYTDLDILKEQRQVLILNTMGMLSSIYRYGEIVLIGGGFRKGIHNTLEAAVYGKPILFGPNYGKFEEAKQLIQCNGAVSVTSLHEGVECINTWLEDDEARELAGGNAKAVVMSGSGSVEKIMETLAKQSIEFNNFFT